MNKHPSNRNLQRHAFEAIQVEASGGEALLATFRVTKARTVDAAFLAAEDLCAEARKLPHKPAAFVREINAPEDSR